MGKEYIEVTWKGKTEAYSSNSWLSPRSSAFGAFISKHKHEDGRLKTLGKFVHGLTDLNRCYERSLFGYTSNTKTPKERLSTSIEDAEAMLNDFLKPYNKDLSKVFSVSSIFHVSAYDSEYYDPKEEDLVCEELSEIIGWKIWGNPWNDNLIDYQKMSVCMHRENNGSLRYNWYMEFRHPDFLVDKIDLDKLFDNSVLEIANMNLEYYDYED